MKAVKQIKLNISEVGTVLHGLEKVVVKRNL